MTSDIKAMHTILQVKKMLPRGLLLLEDNDGRECHEHSRNCIPYHLPIEDTVHPEPTVMPEDFICFVCGEKKRTATMLLCDQCQRGWHMTCLWPPLTSLPFGQWSCLRCRRSLGLGASTNHIK